MFLLEAKKTDHHVNQRFLTCRIMELTNKDNVLVLSIGSDENRFNPTLVENIHKQLTIVEQTQGAKALVITAGGKFFSNGLDLQWLGNNRQQAGAFIQELWKLFARILIFPLPTVSVINGHAFGAGFFLALSCDWRVMRKDRGFLNFPEVRKKKKSPTKPRIYTGT